MPTGLQLADIAPTTELRRKYPEAFFSNPPMLPGTVIPEYVCCGKAGCKCAEGGLHGPYFYHTCWEGARLRRTYVSKGELSAVLAMCRNRQALQAFARQNRAENVLMMRSFTTHLRQLRAEVASARGRQ